MLISLPKDWATAYGTYCKHNSMMCQEIFLNFGDGN